MKTNDLLSCPEATLTIALKGMKAKELERHIRKLLLKLGLNDYDGVMTTVIKAIAELDADKTDRFSALQDLIHSLCSKKEHTQNEHIKNEHIKNEHIKDEQSESEHNTLVERLAIIMMLLVAKKFHKIHGAQG